MLLKKEIVSTSKNSKIYDNVDLKDLDMIVNDKYKISLEEKEAPTQKNYGYKN